MTTTDLRRSFGGRPTAQGHGLRARARPSAPDPVQLRRAAVRRRAVGRKRQARPFRFHAPRCATAASTWSRCTICWPRPSRSPKRKKWILDNQVVPNQVGPGPGRRNPLLSRGPVRPRSGRDADRRPVDRGIPRDPSAASMLRAGPRRGRRHRISAAAAAQHALHPRHHLLDLWRRDAQSALLAGAARGDHPHHRHLQVPSGLRRQGQCLVGRSRPRIRAWPRSKAATSCRSARATC